ncbi:stalk domain-containing protein [Brevibacillus borstelensis]|uniref:stalk domain-containing protein n=1 Tax=Brevibacillus borstelensis TaxID=45462 RepID=UPI002E1D2B5C|nr:stalk domain-containing protein [Brevibacillus borstelensis]
MKKNILMILMSAILILSLGQVVTAAQVIKVFIDGTEQNYEQSPVLLNGTTLVPLRDLFESLGGHLFWDKDSQTAYVTKGKTCLSVQINSTSATVSDYDPDGDACNNPRTVRLNTPAKIINGKTMVPLRFASEYLGAEVLWDQNNSTIQVFSDPNGEEYLKYLVNNYWATPSQSNSQVQQPAVNESPKSTPSNSPIDKNGSIIQVGDRVKFSFFFGEVTKINGGRILVYWDSKDDLWVQDKDVTYMAMLAGIQYKSSSWIDASDLTVQH